MPSVSKTDMLRSGDGSRTMPLHKLLECEGRLPKIIIVWGGLQSEEQCEFIKWKVVDSYEIIALYSPECNLELGPFL